MTYRSFLNGGFLHFWGVFAFCFQLVATSKENRPFCQARQVILQVRFVCLQGLYRKRLSGGYRLYVLYQYTIKVNCFYKYRYFIWRTVQDRQPRRPIQNVKLWITLLFLVLGMDKLRGFTVCIVLRANSLHCAKG